MILVQYYPALKVCAKDYMYNDVTEAWWIKLGKVSNLIYKSNTSSLIGANWRHIIEIIQVSRTQTYMYCV